MDLITKKLRTSAEKILKSKIITWPGRYSPPQIGSFLEQREDTGTLERYESTNDNVTGSSKSRGGDIYGTGTFKIAILEIFGKAGAYFGRTKNEFYDSSGEKVVDESVRETSFAWGVGAAVNLGMLHIRLEYENMHISSGNLAMLSLGAGINLSKKKEK